MINVNFLFHLLSPLNLSIFMIVNKLEACKNNDELTDTPLTFKFYHAPTNIFY